MGPLFGPVDRVGATPHDTAHGHTHRITRGREAAGHDLDISTLRRTKPLTLAGGGESRRSSDATIHPQTTDGARAEPRQRELRRDSHGVRRMWCLYAHLGGEEGKASAEPPPEGAPDATPPTP
jgi:hypothetical protein